MRKVLYNKYVKIIELLCIMATIGMVLCSCIEVADAYRRRNDGKDELKSEVFDYYAISKNMFEEVAPYIQEIVRGYENSGMEGVEAVVEGEKNKWDKVYVTAADREYIYYDGLTPHSIEKRYWYVDQRDRIAKAFEKVKYEIENYDYHYGCTILLNDSLEYTLYNQSSEESQAERKDTASTCGNTERKLLIHGGIS